MELNYLKEKELVAFYFNNLKETAFILYKESPNTKKEQPNGLSLVEEDFHYKLIKKRFKLLQKSECNITNQNYKKNLYNSYEGYSLYFWEASEKLIVIYPFAYVLIYDYNSTDLIQHFQIAGGKAFTLRNLIASPIENCLFACGENLNYIYCLDYSLITKGGEKINELFNNKINLPKDAKIYDIIVHPNEKFIFVGFADGYVRIYDYNNLKKIKELTMPLIDFPEGKEAEKEKDKEKNAVKEADPVTCLDINNIGSYLIEGTEKGNIFLWDAFQAIKEKKLLYKKESLGDNIFSCKFIKTKQFGNLQKFICITKKGTVFIYFILSKDPEQDNNSKNKKKAEKELLIEAVYKKDLYEAIIEPNAIYKYNISLSSLINVSYNNNILSIAWPKFVELELEEKNNKNDCTMVYTSLITKLFFFYSAEYPKINYPLSIQLKNRPYETYFPVQGQPNFENKIYYADNYFIYIYDISSSRHRKLINYAKEFGAKNLYLIKFDIKDMITKVIFFILIETEFHRNSLLIIDFDFEYERSGPLKTIDNINDFVILGNSYLNIESDHAFFLGRDMANGFIFQMSNFNLSPIEIGNEIIRAYHSPFNQGYCMIYRNLKNEFKFTQNFTPDIAPINQNNQPGAFQGVNNYNNLLNLRCGDLFCFQLEEKERIIDILFNTTSEFYFCAVSLIDKINLYNREMKIVSTLKFDLKESPYIISSLIFLDCTLIYARGNKISYFYPYDNINQLILRNNRMPCFISGILPDRFILVSQIANNTLSLSEITSPMISPLEPILIGYLDSPNINYDLLKHGVVTMFTNQVSQNLIDKFISRNLKEIAWMFIDDDKSSFQNLNLKIDMLNEDYKFDNIIEFLNLNKDLTSKLDLDDLIWKFNYDNNYEYIKDILIKEAKLLIEYGQFNSAVKILELLGDYPMALNLLLVSTSPEDFDMLRIKFEAKESLNFTDNLLINHLFTFSKDSQNNNANNIPKGTKMDIGDIFGNNPNPNLNLPNMNEDKMEHYHKIFDNYEGEHFIFGANQNEFKINEVENFKNIMDKAKPKPKGMDFGIQKRVINFGELPFNIYSDDYNISMRQFQTIEICSLVLQKIENYYGIMSLLSKNEKIKMNKKTTFFNYNLSLKQIHRKESIKEEDFDTETSTKRNVPFITAEDLDEDDINPNANTEEISEDLYLSAYYHMDRGSGDTIEDITKNQNNAKIACIYNTDSNQEKKPEKKNILKKPKPEVNVQEDDLKRIWSDVLEENDPLEYEDKWGRRSPPGHSIIFTKKLKTKIIINNSSTLKHIQDKFTIELWIKLKSLEDLVIFSKEALSFGINKGLFTMTFHGQEIPAEIIKQYNLPLDKFIHVTFLYKNTQQNIVVLLNCEEVTKFNFLLSALEIKTPLIFGNEKFDGEMTEIRIWNTKLPIEFIREHYKTPLPILAENKRKLKMNIDNKVKKVKAKESTFSFGDKDKDKISKSQSFGEKKNKELRNSTNPSQNNNMANNDFDFTNNDQQFMNNEFGNDFAPEEYPTMDLVSGNSSDIPVSSSYSGPINNPLNNPLNRFSTPSQEFTFQENDFNFDK